MSSKKKGINAEREVIHLFWQTGKWAAIRISGSGSSRYPSADIIASNVKRKLVIEVKTTKDQNKYFTQEEIDQFLEFSRLFGAEPWLAIKFKANPWFFLKIDDLSQSGKHWVISSQNAKEKGKTFESVIKEF